jgi:hypothetical protein
LYNSAKIIRTALEPFIWDFKGKTLFLSGTITGLQTQPAATSDDCRQVASRSGSLTY